MDSSTQTATATTNPTRSILDSERWLGPLFIGPAVLYIALLVGVPFFMALYYSVSDTTTGGGTFGFVGLRNFAGVIGTPKFQTGLKNTLIFALVSQAVILLLSNALALALQSDFRGKWLLRFLILPISLVVLLFGLIFAFTDMVIIYNLTRGGPYDTTQVLASLAFYTGIAGGDLAEGAGIGLFLFSLLLPVTLGVLRI